MTKKTVLLVLAFIMMSAASVNAQVRIGGLDDPHQSAILDLNTDNESNAGNLGLYLPRVSLTSAKQELNSAPPLNGALVWNTNDDFYLGKGVYVWGDTVWVPIQRTPIGNSTLQPITTVPFVTVLSSPLLGLGATFQVPAAYADMGNTARFLWEIKAVEDPDYVPEILISGSRREVVFVPYDNTERKYQARAKAISNNGTSDSDWSAWIETPDEGKYQGWYRLTGATGYDIKATDYNDATKGRDGDRTQMSLTGNTYTVETVAGINSVTYLWSIEDDETGGLAFLGDDVTNAMVELKFKNSILSNADLVNQPDAAKTFILKCVVNDGSENYTLRRKITVGDRDECSPVAGLRDAEGNFYTVSKFGPAGCWMTQNLRSTYTWQGTQRQDITKDNNVLNDNNAVSYHYPDLNESADPNYGLLYTWGAANIGTVTTEATNAYLNKSSDRQGICPEGWVLPSDYDWNQLEKEIATHPADYSSQIETIAGGWKASYETITDWRPSSGNNATYWGRQMIPV
ncbi:MAG: fibrobacter succinogenes major paralogous domain-containing protein [Tannerella sp.]|jgi:uncharacterized protein (TIGR02145 family)|nr:fibrobacter succinogenes major paralogous domain-containing protein [Tannerella sp.]